MADFDSRDWVSRVGRNDCLGDVGRGSLADVELLGKVHSSASRRLGTVAVVHHGRLLCDVGVVWWRRSVGCNVAVRPVWLQSLSYPLNSYLECTGVLHQCPRT